MNSPCFDIRLLINRSNSLYVMLEIYKLSKTYTSLNTRTRALRAAKANVSTSAAQGYELQEPGSSAVEKAETSGAVQSEEVKTLKKDWANWQNAVVVNSWVSPVFRAMRS